MKNYTDIDDFAKGVAKLNSSSYRRGRGGIRKGMPVLLEVDGNLAPFGLALQKTVNGVDCVVLTGCSSLMDNVTPEKRLEQIGKRADGSRI